MPAGGPRPRAARRAPDSRPPATPDTRPEWLYVGRVTSPFGVTGEVRATLDTDFPERLTTRPLYIGEERRPVKVTGVRFHRREALLRFAGVASVDDAEALRGAELFVAGADAAPLPPGRFYIHQIIGLEVYTTTGERYGVVTDVLSRPANDIYVIARAGREVLAPAIQDVVKAIDLPNKRLVIDPIPGLE